MKLDEYEFDYVKYFIQTKGNYDYEVLAEILDHFVLLLEDRREEFPELPFEDLVNETYQNFGAVAFKEINASTRQRIIKKYGDRLLKNLFSLLHYKIVLGLALVGLIIYQIQYQLRDVIDFLMIHSFSTLMMYVFAYKYVTGTGDGNPKFMINKMASKYGFYLLIGAGLIFRIIMVLVVKPQLFDLNIYYLSSVILLLLQGLVLYALLKTAKEGVEESEMLEETYQVLK